jgi:FtsZ-binding cell division protein ZapB
VNLATSSASRAAKPSPLRRKALGVLITGTVLAGAAALGPAWLARSGVVLAVVTGMVACAYAWREITHGRRQHASEMLTASRRHGVALAEERAHNASVVEVLATRAGGAQAEVERSRHVIAGMHVEVRTLRTEVTGLRAKNQTLRAENQTLHEDNQTLREDNQTLREDNQTLRETVRAREAEMQLLRSPDDLSSLAGMPRATAELATADSAWRNGVVREGVVVDERTWGDTALILPNYEHLTA